MAKTKATTEPKDIAVLYADLHCGGGYPSRGIDDSLHALQQVIDYATNSPTVQTVVDLGDSLDRARNLSMAVTPLRMKLKELAGGGVNFLFIQGNHDHAGPGVLPWLFDNDAMVQHVHKKVVTIGDFVWAGHDYAPAAEIQDWLTNEIPGEATGLFLHQCWGDFMGSIASPQMSAADIPLPIVRVATGDYHGESIVKTLIGKDGQKILVTNPGSMSVQSIIEPQDKFFVAFRSDGSFRRIPLVTRQMLTASVLSEEDMTEFLEEIERFIDEAYARGANANLPEDMLRPLMRVAYSASVTGAWRRIQKVVGDRVHLFPSEVRPEKVDGKSTVVDVKGRVASLENTFRPYVEQFLVDNGMSGLTVEVTELVELLINKTSAEEVRREIEAWRVKQLEG